MTAAPVPSPAVPEGTDGGGASCRAGGGERGPGSCLPGASPPGPGPSQPGMPCEPRVRRRLSGPQVTYAGTSRAPGRLVLASRAVCLSAPRPLPPPVAVPPPFAPRRCAPRLRYGNRSLAGPPSTPGAPRRALYTEPGARAGPRSDPSCFGTMPRRRRQQRRVPRLERRPRVGLAFPRRRCPETLRSPRLSPAAAIGRSPRTWWARGLSQRGSKYP